MQIGLSGNPQSVTGPKKSRIGKNQSRRNQAVSQQTLWSIKIGENQIKKLCALGEASFDRSPFIRWDQQRDHVQFPRAIHSLRITIDIVGHAMLANDAASVLPTSGEFFAA